MYSIIIFIREEIVLLVKLILPIYFTMFISNLNDIFMPAIAAGHIGDVDRNYAAVGLGTAFIASVGVYPHMFISCAVSTLGSQAFGAGRNKELGTLLQRGVLIHTVMCLPMAILWLNAESILIWLNQSPELSRICGEYIEVFIAILPAYALLYPAIRTLQVQNIVVPTMCILACGTVLEAVLIYTLTTYTSLGVRGIALAVVLTVYFQAVAHLVYIRCSRVWSIIWEKVSWYAVKRWGEYLYFGVPVLITTLLHVAVFSLGNIVIGANSPNPAIELSEYSAVQYIEYALFVLPSCMNIASSIRVGNLVGEDNMRRMKKVCILTTCVTFLLEIVQISVLLAGSSLWGKLFISDQQVAHGIVDILFVIAAYQPIDGMLVNFQGILIGIGKQSLGLIFPIAFFIIAIPSAVALSVVANLGPLGYWMGIMIAFITRVILLIPLNLCCLKWNQIQSVLDPVS